MKRRIVAEIILLIVLCILVIFFNSIKFALIYLLVCEFIHSVDYILRRELDILRRELEKRK